jgi:DNA-binding response OmpR family regulator
VLVVEDEPPLRELITVTLAGTFDCREAASGERALEMLHADVPDLVLVDVMLPGKSGLDVVTEMRDDPQLRDVPVIVLSAWQAPHDVERALAAGADRFLSKPFQVEELAATAEELVRRVA